jgi:hypothetical protein
VVAVVRENRFGLIAASDEAVSPVLAGRCGTVVPRGGVNSLDRAHALFCLGSFSAKNTALPVAYGASLRFGCAFLFSVTDFLS